MKILMSKTVGYKLWISGLKIKASKNKAVVGEQRLQGEEERN
jgi:hypothetical protein